MPSGARLGAHRLRLQQDVVEARRVELLPDLDQVAVGALHQAVEHLDDVEAGAERRVHRAHLEADDAAADDQHALGLHRQLERAGRGDDARVVLRHERQLHRLGAGGDDRAREADRRRAAGGEVDDDVVGVAEAAAAGDDRHLAHLRHLRQAAGQPADDLVLVRDELARRSTLGAPNSTPRAPKCATSSITAATCSIAFDGMQPTLRQTPPSVL